MRQRLAALILALSAIGFCSTAAAQRLDPATEQRIKALEARVAELERREAMQLGAPAAPATPYAAQPVAPHAAPVAPVVPAAPLPPAKVADWTALHRGMSQREVTNALGAPGDKRVLPLTETWYYPDTSGRSVQFNRDGRVENWSSP